MSTSKAVLVGVVDQIAIVDVGSGPARLVDEARVVPGGGVEGDRHFAGAAPRESGCDLTLIAAEVVEDLGLDATTHRRNVVVRGIDVNLLVGQRFRVGEVECVGVALCEPCAHLDGLAGGGGTLLRALVHRGGLEAEVFTQGVIRVGDRVST